MIHQCSTMFNENRNFKKVINNNAPRFKGCFLGIYNNSPTYPFYYCRFCIMSNPETGICEKGSE